MEPDAHTLGVPTDGSISASEDTDMPTLKRMPDLGLRSVAWYERTYDSGAAAFIVVFYDPSRSPRQKQITLKSSASAKAQAEAFDKGRAWHLGLYDPWEAVPDDLSLKAAVDAWLASGAAWSTSTKRGRKGITDLFLKEHKSRSLAGVTPDDVERFVRSPRLGPESQKSYYTVLNTFFRWCASKGYLKTVPTAAKAKPRGAGRSLHYFTRAELERFSEAAEAHYARVRRQADPGGRGAFIWIRDLTTFAVATGLRKGELRHLRWCDVDLEHGRIYVRSYTGTWMGRRVAFKTKCGSDRDLELFPAARDVLRRRWSQRRTESDHEPVFCGPSGAILGESQINRAFRRVRVAARLPDGLDVHACRHTFAAWMLTAGESLFRVSRMLGHRGIKQTSDCYGHLLEGKSGVGERVFT